MMLNNKRTRLRYGGVGLILVAVAFFALPTLGASAWPNPDAESKVEVCVDGVGSNVLITVYNRESGNKGSPGRVTQGSLVFDPPLQLPNPVFSPDPIPNTGDSFATALISVPPSYTGEGMFSYRMSWSGTSGSDLRPAAHEPPAKIKFTVTACNPPTTTTTEPPTTTTTEPPTTTTTEPPTTTTTEPPTTTTTEPPTTTTTEPPTTTTTEPPTTTTTEPPTTTTTEPPTTTTTEPPTTTTTEPETTTTTEPETTTTTEPVTTTTRKPCPPGTEIVGENGYNWICQPTTTTTVKGETTTTAKPTCDDLTQEEAQLRLEGGDQSLDPDNDGVACSESALIPPTAVSRTLPVTGSNLILPIVGGLFLTGGLAALAASRKVGASS